jgi:hypothetical protein
MDAEGTAIPGATTRAVETGIEARITRGNDINAEK